MSSYPDSADVAVLVSWQAINPGIYTNTRIEVRVGGWTFLAASDSAVKEMTLSHTASSKVCIGPGVHTFTLHVGNDWHQGAWNLGNWALTLLDVMR